MKNHSVKLNAEAEFSVRNVQNKAFSQDWSRLSTFREWRDLSVVGV